MPLADLLTLGLFLFGPRLVSNSSSEDILSRLRPAFQWCRAVLPSGHFVSVEIHWMLLFLVFFHPIEEEDSLSPEKTLVAVH